MLAIATQNNVRNNPAKEPIEAEPEVTAGPHFAGPLAPMAEVAEEEAELDATPDACFAGLVRRTPQTGAANDEPTFDPDERKSMDKRRLARVVGPRLQRARLSAGYTQGEAASILGWGTPAQLSQAEQGRRLAPPGALIAASRAYGVSLSYLYGESEEIDRDQAAGHRAGVLRGVRHALDTVAQVVIEQIDRHERLVGPGAIHVRGLIKASRQLGEAVATLMRANAETFDEMRGSATVVRASQELTDSIVDAERRLRLHEARDAELRAALSSMHDEDIPLPENGE